MFAKDASLFRQEVVKFLGIPDEECLSQEQEKASYTAAFHLYQQKSYRKAAHVFTTLVLANPFASDYWKGLASSKQMAREYEAALHAWALLALLVSEEATPHVHAAECLLALHEEEEARKAFTTALTLRPDPSLQPILDQLKKRLYVTH